MQIIEFTQMLYINESLQEAAERTGTSLRGWMFEIRMPSDVNQLNEINTEGEIVGDDERLNDDRYMPRLWAKFDVSDFNDVLSIGIDYKPVLLRIGRPLADRAEEIINVRIQSRKRNPTQAR